MYSATEMILTALIFSMLLACYPRKKASDKNWFDMIPSSISLSPPPKFDELFVIFVRCRHCYRSAFINRSKPISISLIFMIFLFLKQVKSGILKE